MISSGTTPYYTNWGWSTDKLKITFAIQEKSK
jgi:hypothetical protein